MIERTPSAEPTAAPETASHLELLRLLELHPEYSQRQMASALGVSVGKTHYVLKALLKKGWVKAQNFRRSSNKIVYIYVLTPNGLAHRLQLTQDFLLRKEQEYLALKSEITALRRELASGSPRRSSAHDSV